MDKNEGMLLAGLLMERERAREEYIQLWKEVAILCDVLKPRLRKIRKLRKEYGFTPEMGFGKETAG